jgi:hypothetical protein
MTRLLLRYQTSPGWYELIIGVPMGVLGDLRLISGSVTDEFVSKGSMLVEIAGEVLTMPFSTSNEWVVEVGSEVEFAARRRKFFTGSFVGRAVRRKNGKKIYPGRTSHYWVGILMQLAVSGFWIFDSLRSRHGFTVSFEPDFWFIWPIAGWCIYSVLGIIETREAVTMLRKTER